MITFLVAVAVFLFLTLIGMVDRLQRAEADRDAMRICADAHKQIAHGWRECAEKQKIAIADAQERIEAQERVIRAKKLAMYQHLPAIWTATGQQWPTN